MPKPSVPDLSGPRVSLRLTTREDLAKTLAWRNQNRVREMFIYSAIIEMEGHKKWFESYLERDNDLLFMISETSEPQAAIVQIGIYDIDFANKSAEFGRLMIGEETALGKGLAKEAAMLLLDFCDGTLGLESIYLEVKQSNPRARNLYTTLGFSETQVTDSLITMHRRNHALAKLEI